MSSSQRCCALCRFPSTVLLVPRAVPFPPVSPCTRPALCPTPLPHSPSSTPILPSSPQGTQRLNIWLMGHKVLNVRKLSEEEVRAGMMREGPGRRGRACARGAWSVMRAVVCAWQGIAQAPAIRFPPRCTPLLFHLHTSFLLTHSTYYPPTPLTSLTPPQQPTIRTQHSQQHAQHAHATERTGREPRSGRAQ